MVQAQLSVKTTSNIYIYNYNAYTYIYMRGYMRHFQILWQISDFMRPFSILSCYSFHNLKTVGSISEAKFCQFADCAKGPNCKLSSNQPQWVDIHSEYHRVASTNTYQLEACSRSYRLLIKGKFDVYLLWIFKENC